MSHIDKNLESIPFRNPDLSLEERIDDLIERLTLEEKQGMLSHESPAIEHLGIPFYTWWGEALHGHARGGKATVFPQAVGLAATFDAELMERIGRVIGDETRAKYHAALRIENRTNFLVLTHMSPTVNILRDPRWGRNQETYGEDPFLTATMGKAFVRGVQGDDPRYLKAACFAKHFAVHSGPEEGRYSFNAVVSEKDLQETYLYAFRRLVEDAKVEGIMGSYNAVNGEPCCVSPTLLKKNLKEKWGFEGTVISDGGGLHWARAKGQEKDEDRKELDDWNFARDQADWKDKHMRQAGHGVADSAAEITAMALKNGIDLDMGKEFHEGLVEAVETGQVDIETVDAALRRVLKTRFKLGMFDPDERVPFANMPEDIVHCEEHVEIAWKAAVESTVLLKNADDTLPLASDVKSILMAGPNAANVDSLLGSYYGQAPRMVTLTEGVTNNISPATSMLYARFCPITGGVLKKKGWKQDRGRPYDYVIAAMGLSPLYEGEAGGDPEDSPWDGDRFELGLPGKQLELLKSLRECGRKMIVVVYGGSPVEIEWAMENADAVLFVFYPGEQGGQAIADVIFGKAAPSGRMPFTTPRSLDDLPDFADYAMENRTYRYSQTEPLIPFGFGLGYTRFEYLSMETGSDNFRKGDTLEVRVKVRNTGESGGEEVVQLYLTHHDAPEPAPLYALRAVRRISIAPGEETDALFSLTDKELSVFDENGEEVVCPGKITLTAGGACPHKRSGDLGAAATVSKKLTIHRSV
ncbi:MAG: glycoside hydrolase family 3 N-terminal domain-containing protein [Candidatus Sumerlaeota bacterium]